MIDVLVIGSGAGGSALALSLAQAGLQVLVLEKGRRHDPPRDYLHDELEATFGDLFTPSPQKDPHVVVRPDGETKRSNLGWTAVCVGGGTQHMGGFLYRFHPDDFRLRSRFGGDTGDALVDWPYDYEELEPWYSKAEWEVGVAGAAGSNPFEGPRSRPYPLEPVRTHPLTETLDRAAQRLGLHPFPTPRSVNPVPYGGRPACSYCRLCAGFGCPTGARGTAGSALLPRAEATGRCRVVAEAMVREITVGPDGRATGCVYLDREGAEHRVRASVVCLSASAVESARLLLLSRSPLFPDGLGNGSGLVGRHLQLHAYSGARGRFEHGRHPDLPLEDPHPFLERSVMDHYFLPEGISEPAKGGLYRFGFPQMQPIMESIFAARRNGNVLWGRELKRALRERFLRHRTVGFEVFHDYLPGAGTFVELDPEVRDPWGLPAARIHLDPSPHHERVGRWLVDQGMELLQEMGVDEVEPAGVGETVPFLVHGTCRAGDDPERSVLDPHCRSHEVPNLFVVDGSFMPVSGGAAPTLTILANAFRTADHVAALARRSEL